jgi:hypothetical protein
LQGTETLEDKFGIGQGHLGAKYTYSRQHTSRIIQIHSEKEKESFYF